MLHLGDIATSPVTEMHFLRLGSYLPGETKPDVQDHTCRLSSPQSGTTVSTYRYGQR